MNLERERQNLQDDIQGADDSLPSLNLAVWVCILCSYEAREREKERDRNLQDDIQGADDSLPSLNLAVWV